MHVLVGRVHGCFLFVHPFTRVDRGIAFHKVPPHQLFLRWWCHWGGGSGGGGGGGGGVRVAFFRAQCGHHLLIHPNLFGMHGVCLVQPVDFPSHAEFFFGGGFVFLFGGFLFLFVHPTFVVPRYRDHQRAQQSFHFFAGFFYPGTAAAGGTAGTPSGASGAGGAGGAGGASGASGAGGLLLIRSS